MQTLLLSLLFAAQLTVSNAVTNFILVGSTGDLSKKYLWEALFIEFVEAEMVGSLNIYAAATRNPDEGLSIISSYINALHCKDSWAEDTCRRGLRDFRGALSYVQLKGDADYDYLQRVLAETDETLRIFYLSVSPSLYEALAATINDRARPPSVVPLRVVFEKPFGKDLDSAVTLSDKLAVYLSDSEIYRVDHYLGKVGMRAVIEFRRLNYGVLKSLHFPSLYTPENAHMSDEPRLVGESSAESDNEMLAPLVEVVMTEREHTAGRSSYYDSFGVIRDVMQNHLTQALVYSLMHLGEKGNEEVSRDEEDGAFGSLASRVDILRNLKYSPQLHVPGGGATNVCADLNDLASREGGTTAQTDATNRHMSLNLWLGQYEKYGDHLHDDLLQIHRRSRRTYASDALAADDAPGRSSSNTPTAASVVFSISYVVDHCNEDVCPADVAAAVEHGGKRSLNIIVAAGKALSEREMFIRVTSARSSLRGTIDQSVRYSDDEVCRMTFGVQGGVHRHSPYSTDSGPYMLLEGSCWSERQREEVRLPSDWFPELSCPMHMRRVLRYDGSGDDNDEAAAAPSEGNNDTGGYARNKCIIRPLYTLESADIRVRTYGEGEEGVAVQHSSKYRNNAYVDIFGALFSNDRSYFTTTEELLAQWTLWDSVLKDAECAAVQSYDMGWSGLH